MTDSETTARQYDAMAADYASSNADGPYNAYYERPAMISLVGQVAGLRVLDAGCGSGQLAAHLVSHGADLTGIDVSPAMVEIARRQVPGRAELLVADIASPLIFAHDTEFDLIVASLVMHYIHDWEPVLAEFRRVLTATGSLVLSTHHPAMDWQAHSPDDYFAIKQVTEAWAKGPGEYQVTFWRRPLTAMCQAIYKSGFLIEQLVEPAPLPGLETYDPEAFQLITTQPRFIFFRLRPTVG
jgi:SAM-dependent methyltransferase